MMWALGVLGKRKGSFLEKQREGESLNALGVMDFGRE